MKKLLIILWALVALTGCESLEETYADYAGDGKIRYLGMCKDITLVPGWERLTVTWKNNIDPVIENIQVSWIVNGVRKDSLLPRDATSCDIRNLKDGNYEVIVNSMDKNGNKSITVNAYGRPYTLDHEIVQTFSRVVIKNFFIRDRLVLFFDKWNNNIQSAEMSYTLADGTLKTLALTETVVAQKYYLLPDKIDPAKPVSVNRKGYIDKSTDLILFRPYVLEHDCNFTTDFKLLLKSEYGQMEISKEFVENQTELEIDYSMNSIEDLLYFPKLAKLYLGKSRFMLPQYAGYPSGTDGYYCGNASKVIDDASNSEKTLFVLNTANTLNGLKVERYNEHFIPRRNSSNLSYLTEKGNPVAPARIFLDSTQFSYKCNVVDAVNYDSHMEFLFDGDLETAWLPEQLGNPRRYAITVDFKNVRKINGVQIIQRSFNPRTERNYLSFMPGMVLIQGSTNGATWFNVAYIENYTLGNTIGETTEINFREEAGDIRYLRFTLNDLPMGSNYCISLAELRMF